jgi:hypothetical protein
MRVGVSYYTMRYTEVNHHITEALQATIVLLYFKKRLWHAFTHSAGVLQHRDGIRGIHPHILGWTLFRRHAHLHVDIFVSLFQERLDERLPEHFPGEIRWRLLEPNATKSGLNATVVSIFSNDERKGDR